MKGRSSHLTGSHTDLHYTPTPSALLHSKNEWKVGAVILQAVTQIHTTLPHLQLSCTARVEGRNIAVTGPHDTPTPCGNVTPQQEWKAETLQSQVHTTLPHHVGMWHLQPTSIARMESRYSSLTGDHATLPRLQTSCTAKMKSRNSRVLQVIMPHSTPSDLLHSKNEK